MNYITDLVDAMKYSIEKYGLWQTVAAFAFIAILVSLTAVAIRLPEVLQALK